MKIVIYGNGRDSELLYEKVVVSLEELGLNDFIEVGKTLNDKLKEKIKIEKNPALIVEEESIDFADIIFEGIIPSDEEITSILISIIGGKGSDCGPGGECGVSCFC